MSENLDAEVRNRPKKTVIGSFFGRIHRSKSRGGGEVEKKRNEKLEKNCSKSVSSSISDGNIGKKSDDRSRPLKPMMNRDNSSMSPARRLINKFSFRSSSRNRTKTDDFIDNNDGKHLSGAPPVKTTSEHDLHSSIIKTPNKFRKTHFGGTTTISEMDLRFVTTRNDHASIPINEEFGFGDKSPRGFLSETDLSSGVIDFPEVNRTPSYLRISCALNGYTRSPTKGESINCSSRMGESLVERRLRMFNEPQNRPQLKEFNSPVVSTTTSTTTTTMTSESNSSENTSWTPANKLTQQKSRIMGNQVSTPGPIKDLISKFDKLELCSSSKSSSEKEGIEPHKLVINEQPDFENVVESTKDPNGNEVEIEEKCEENKEPLKLSLDVESDSGISGSANFSPDGNGKLEELSKMPENGDEFRKLHDRVKEELEKKMEEANKDFEIIDDLPEKCADTLRASHGNAHLLVRKKFGKFNELIEKHLNPIDNDPMPVNLPDLEAFWMTIELELDGIRKEFEKVEKYRNANWDVAAVADEIDEKIVVETPKLVKTPGNGAQKKKTPIAMSAEAKEKLERQRAAAEQRRAEMRAQMKQKMQELKENETSA